jgi:hypothetical protein
MPKYRGSRSSRGGHCPGLFHVFPTEAIIEVTPTRVSALNLEGTVRVVSLQEGIPGEVVLQPGEDISIELGKPPTPSNRWLA